VPIGVVKRNPIPGNDAHAGKTIEIYIRSASAWCRVEDVAKIVAKKFDGTVKNLGQTRERY
jgi:hypothetical protein